MPGRWPLILLLLVGCASRSAAPLRPLPAPGSDLVRVGDRLRRQGADNEADRAYRQALAAEPGNVRAQVGRQQIALERGEHLALRRQFEAGPDAFLAGRLEPTPERQREKYELAPEPLRTLGLGLAEAEEDPGSVSARNAFRRARQMDPGLPWARLGLARELLMRGRLGEAEAEYLAAAWNDPENPEPWRGLSAIADRRGDLEEAYAWGFEAFVRGPRDVDLATRLHELATRSGSATAVTRAAHALTELGAASGGIGLLYAADLWGQLGDDGRRAGALELAGQAGATPREIEALKRPPLPPAMKRFVAEFVRGVVTRYRHYAATGEHEGFEDFHHWSRALYERTTGEKLGPAGRTLDYAFVGKLIDPRTTSNEPLVRACAAHGLLLVLGQRRGGPPEAMLAGLVRLEPARKIELRGETIEREAAFVGRRYVSGYAEWAGGGDLAGLALDHLILIDLDALARWEGDVRRMRARLAPRRERLLAAPPLEAADVRSIEDPAGVTERLYLVAKLDLTGEVVTHENAHLVDAARHLPVGDHMMRNLRLALQGGFSASEILALLERNAQLTAIAEGPSARGALASCCAMLGEEGVHARAYGAIVQGMVDLILLTPEAYPEIDPTRVVVQQLHRLPEEKVRSLARELMLAWHLDHE